MDPSQLFVYSVAKVSQGGLFKAVLVHQADRVSFMHGAGVYAVWVTCDLISLFVSW